MCRVCKREGNGFNYSYETCRFSLDVSCNLILDILTHPSHEHRLLVVMLKLTQYSVVPFANLLWTSNVLHYHKPQGINNVSIPSLSVILLNMTPENIIVISVKKNKTQSIGCTTVQNEIILYIPNVFLGSTQISSLEMHTNLTGIHIPLLSLRKLKTSLNVSIVVILAWSFFINVLNVISTYIMNV